jgi:hypothetical protein
VIQAVIAIAVTIADVASLAMSFCLGGPVFGCEEAVTRQIGTWRKAAVVYHPCLAARLGGVSGGREIQGWRDSSHTAMVGAGKFGSAKLPMATATYPGKPSFSQ